MGQFDNETEKENKFRIISWNLWCMLVVAPRALSNPDRCSKYLIQTANKNKWTQFDGLMVCGLQELWSWNTAIFPTFILSNFGRLLEFFELIPYLGMYVSILLQLITFLFGCLPLFKISKHCTFQYCPKSNFAETMKSIFEYSYFNNDIPFYKLSDNGLVLLSNQKVDLFGFHAFQNCLFDDSLANKGFIFGYFKSYHCLVINTHLQSAGDGIVRLKQMNEIKQFVDKNKEKYENKLKVIILGDFNIDIKKSKIFIPKCFGPDFRKINSYQPTFHKKNIGCIDHIIVNFNIKSVNEQITGKEDMLSDHFMIVNEFESSDSKAHFK